MSHRTMRYMRQHGKKVMVFMGIVCMFTFVVGYSVLDLVTGGRSGQPTTNPVAVTWTKGRVHETELNNLRNRHRMAVQFVNQIAMETIQRGGKPMVNGQEVSRTGDIGFPPDP